MGSNNLSSRSNTQIVQAADVNQYRTALNQDVVPRNSSGVATDVGGGLGTSLLRWATSYIRDLYIGAFSSTLRIYEGSAGDAGKLLLTAGAATNPVKIEATGLDGATIKAASIPFSGLDSTHCYAKATSGSEDITVPTGANRAFGYLVGGGGGGGGGGGPFTGGGSQNGGGGAGGGGAGLTKFAFTVTAGETLTVTVGAGGTAGAAGSTNSNGGNGGAGLTSEILRSSTSLVKALGGDGGPGGQLNAGGTAVAGAFTKLKTTYGGGNGGAAATGSAGESSNCFSGGAGGTGTGGAGGGGGGGGASEYAAGGAGGVGGVSTTPGTVGTAGTIGSGGGGGGGADNDSGVAAAGAAGGAGFVIIQWGRV